MATDRLPPIPPERWTDEQRSYAAEIINGPRGELVAPFVPLLRSPELMGHVQRLGAHLRYRSRLVPRLSELAILVTAREWAQQVEWAIHAPIAEQAGVARAIIDSIARGRRPSGMALDEAAVYDLCVELQRERGVCDGTWQQAVELFGEAGTVELIAIVGYYAMLSMVMNAARTPAPSSTAPPLAPESGWQE